MTVINTASQVVGDSAYTHDASHYLNAEKVTEMQPLAIVEGGRMGGMLPR